MLRAAQLPFSLPQRWGIVLRLLFLAAVAAYLFDRLTALGWSEVAAGVPRDASFYLLFVLIFLAVPASEWLAYGRSWAALAPPARYWRSFPVFVRKRIFNTALFDFSGDLMLAGWARKAFGLPFRTALETVKDNYILATSTSAALAATLIAVYLATGQPAALFRLDNTAALSFAAGAMLLPLLWPVALVFKRNILALSGTEARTVVGIYGTRFVIVQLLQLLQWRLVLPDVALQTWFGFLVVHIVLTRVPVLPAKDLLFLGAGIGLASAAGLPEAAVAGMLLATSALTHLGNLILFVLTSFVTHD